MTEQGSREQAGPEQQREPVPPEAEPSFFRQLVEQPENFFEASALWGGSDQDREELLNEIATLAMHFTIARIWRFQKLRGTPQAVKVRIEVEVAGDVEKTESGLILP